MIINILAVDDVEANLFSLESLILDYKLYNKDIEKINFIQALSGEEALKIVLNINIDLILLDVQMPGMDGFETAKFLKLNPKTKDIPIVFLTAAFKSDEFVKYGFEVGATDYFTKPIEKYQFLNKLNLYISLFAKTKKLQKAFLSLEQESKKSQEQEKLIIKQSRLAQMGEMISMIAHQWRQPLGAISSTTVNLRMKLELDFFDFSTKDGIEEAKNYFKRRLTNVEEYVQNLTTTIDDFRNFYKPDKESVITTLEQVVKKALKIMKNSLIVQNIELIYHFNSKLIVKLYDNEVMQVILNILKNAQDNFIETHTKNPKIIITTKENEINIRDNGGGIPVDIIENIYDPYFSTKDEKNGTGLGLYMSKIIIEKHHNGILSVVNYEDEDGRIIGACFTIKINN
ncbi:MAG: hybrid sensor histidine kinase/response regulator [Sulfurimonas sp.]|nr:hybrid sensor histidine kinase/response regulator [Sulfurimonas sp.]